MSLGPKSLRDAFHKSERNVTRTRKDPRAIPRKGGQSIPSMHLAQIAKERSMALERERKGNGSGRLASPRSTSPSTHTGRSSRMVLTDIASRSLNGRDRAKGASDIPLVSAKATRKGSPRASSDRTGAAKRTPKGVNNPRLQRRAPHASMMRAASDPTFASRSLSRHMDPIDEGSMEEEAIEASGKRTFASRIRDIRKNLTKAKAERAFTRQYGEDASFGSGRGGASQAAEGQGGARAALYKGMMGRSQRKSQRMQSNRGTAKSASMPAKAGSRAAAALSGFSLERFSKPLIAICLIAVVSVFLYGPAQQYYVQMRDTEALQARYDAVLEHNDSLQSEIDYLNSEEGIQDRAREELGYVMSDETAGAVKGADAMGIISERKTHDIKTYEVNVPQQWFSPMLDTLFGWSADI